MKTVLLAGGKGSRLSEETVAKPKPMVEIGGKPILWHIMKIYHQYGFKDFVICLGYKGYMIKEYFKNYFYHQSDFTVDLVNNQTVFHYNQCEDWKITLIDTGEDTLTGGRIKRIQDYIGNETFMMTYGDGVANINIENLIQQHRKKQVLATMTAVQPSGRFGALSLDSNSNITNFQEKPKGDGNWINGGFFVLEPGIFNYIKTGDACVWEQDPLANLALDGQLAAYKHEGFWQPMDKLLDKNYLQELWDQNKAPWKTWGYTSV